MSRAKQQKIFLGQPKMNNFDVNSTPGKEEVVEAYIIPTTSRDLKSTGNMKAFSATPDIATKSCSLHPTAAAFDLSSTA